MDHSRTILHFDIDYFYAQVEILGNPSYKDQPIGIKQKNFLVTCNYVARAQGVQKGVSVHEAQSTLPSLILIDGSDLTEYRKYSAAVFSMLRNFTENVERLGMDENFVDVSDQLENFAMDSVCDGIIGNVFGNENYIKSLCKSNCNCFKRLCIGSHLAKKLRNAIYENIGLTCCVGIAHNKLLAKLVSGCNKPDGQTVVFPWQVGDVMKTITSIKDIPGIGSSTFNKLKSAGIKSCTDLQQCDSNLLETLFPQEFALSVNHWSFGIDTSAVKSSGKSQSLGVEDSSIKIGSLNSIKNILKNLTYKLLKLLHTDGRLPLLLRVCIRRFSKVSFNNRESKQISLSPAAFNKWFKNSDDVEITAYLIQLSLKLIKKLVNTAKPFHLTLIGISFSKLVVKMDENKSIASYFKREFKSQTELESCKDSLNEIPLNLNTGSLERQTKLHLTNQDNSLSPDIDQGVFKSLSQELQSEICEQSRHLIRPQTAKENNSSKKDQSKITSFFSPSSSTNSNEELYSLEHTLQLQNSCQIASTSSSHNECFSKISKQSVDVNAFNIKKSKENSKRQDTLLSPDSIHTKSTSIKAFLVSKGIDWEVFYDLNFDLQKEILSQYPDFVL